MKICKLSALVNAILVKIFTRSQFAHFRSISLGGLLQLLYLILETLVAINKSLFNEFKRFEYFSIYIRTFQAFKDEHLNLKIFKDFKCPCKYFTLSIKCLDSIFRILTVYFAATNYTKPQ